MEAAVRPYSARPDIEPATAPPTPVPARLRREPALDGLRGLAVVAVVVFHLGHIDGGFLGVDLFFVLSGFLITSLLVTEHRRHGAIDLRAFWVRRARRLLPALLLTLAGVGALLAALTPAADRPRFRGDALATLGYAANWHRMAADVTYWDIFSQPSPLDHTWSLAIEEQFYVFWPLVVLGVLAVGLRRRPAVRGAGDAAAAGAGRAHAPGSRVTAGRVPLLGVASAAGAAVSLMLLAATYSPVDTNRAYFATDTRLGPTLVGAALAALVAGRRRRESAPGAGADVAGALALAWIAWSLVAVDGQGAWYYRGGLATFAVAAAVVIACVTGGPPGRVAGLLSARPLVALGAISYGVYLWHWPVIVYLTADRAPVGGLALDGLRVVVTLALAFASYHAVEQPVRRGALRGHTAALVTAGAVAAVAALTVVVTRGPSVDEGDAAEIAPTDTRPYSIFPDEGDVPAGATRLLLVGDSGPIFLGPELVTEAEHGDEVAVAMSSQLQCTPLLVGGRVRYPGDRIVERPVCTDTRRASWDRAVARFHPDVVVYYLANAGGFGEGVIDGEWVTDCDPGFDAHLAGVLAGDLDLLGAGGATVVLATSPYTDTMAPRAGAHVDCRNATYRRVAERVPGARILDLNAFVQDETAAAGHSLLRDFVHLDHDGATRVARWLVPQVPGLATTE